MRYLVRSVKYFVKLCVICTAAFLVMVLANMTPLTPAEAPAILFHTPQGWILIVAAVVLAAFYPRFGFLTRQVAGDVEANRQQVINALKSAGYALTPGGNTDGKLTFRAANPLRRMAWLWEDTITAGQYGQWIVLSGPGKHVASVENKLRSFLEQAR